MPLVVNTNTSSLNAQRHLSANTNALNKTLERLSSGYRINRAADDAAGLQISEVLRSQIRGVGQAINNAEDGNNMLQVAEGTLSVINEHLQRIRELMIQGASDTYATAQRDALETEIKERILDITRVASATAFNGIKMLSATVATMTLQVGPGNTVNDVIDIAQAFGVFRASAGNTNIGLATTNINFNSNASAQVIIASVDLCMTNVQTALARIGAYQNRLDSAISNLRVAQENFSASESRIRNADIAMESSQLARNQILQQASASILAQANQAPQLALTLIRQ